MQSYGGNVRAKTTGIYGNPRIGRMALVLAIFSV
jgi:hypothetical protein